MRSVTLVLCAACVLVTSTLGCSTSPDVSDLEPRLVELADAFDGRAGLYVRHLDTGQEIVVDADSLFPTASMIKVPIMLKVFDRIAAGELDYRQEMVYRDSLFYSDADLTGELRDSATVELDKLIHLMITLSDNTASLWLQQMAGGGEAINAWLGERGFVGTRVNSRTEGRQTDWQRYGWGQTTPREMAELLVMIREGRAVGPAEDEEMLRVLSGSYWREEALSRIPPGIQAASKQGAVSASKSEVVLVNAPHGDYVFFVITDDQADTRWEYDNEGYVLIREVSSILWNAFEPGQPYEPKPLVTGAP